MKKTMTGWIGKSNTSLSFMLYIMSTIAPAWQNKKGGKINWCESEWPPRKVKITIEEI